MVESAAPLHPATLDQAFLAWTILLAPLVASVGILLFGVHRRRLACACAIVALVVAFVFTCILFLQAVGHSTSLPIESAVSWIALPGLAIQFGVYIDQLSLLMTLVVTGVGSAIFLYSIGYMADEHGYSRYFALLSLFAFSMLTIVLATNWIQLFIGWELVGFCSYILIGHWYAKSSAADAGKKAFMVNRVADFGFLLGILVLWGYVSNYLPSGRTFHFHTLQMELPGVISAGIIPSGLLVIIGLLLFCGPLGKSAQFPLHVWLPDAMEGPTPVSALIHAATMVAAGVYMLCRTFWLFEAIPGILITIAWVGGITAFLTACLALVENDLKRILAYSTLSQLGYMVLALGMGGAIAGMYHLTTHAFFKALLFLAAGSVIHSTHQQDIRKLGGLRISMPWTSYTFLIGALALCGIPGFSGFFSKEEILAAAYDKTPLLYWLGTITAGLTAFYIGRAWFVSFMGKPQSHGHESPRIMVGPLVFLAALSIVGGYLAIPHFLGEVSFLQSAHHEVGVSVALFSFISVAAGLFLSWIMYGARLIRPDNISKRLGALSSLLQNHYFIDDAYDWYVSNVQQRIIAGTCSRFERSIIIGVMVNGTAALTGGFGRAVRLFQTGKIQTYVAAFLIGIAWLLIRSFHL